MGISTPGFFHLQAQLKGQGADLRLEQRRGKLELELDPQPCLVHTFNPKLCQERPMNTERSPRFTAKERTQLRFLGDALAAGEALQGLPVCISTGEGVK